MTITDTFRQQDDDLPDINDESTKEFYAKYEMKNVLGKGVSSTVRRCMLKKTKVEYAAKIIDVTNEKEMEELREATKKEIEILGMCRQQKNIILLLDTFESPSFLFLVFELCPKGELFDYLTEVVTLSEKRTRIIMKQLGDAIKFIHDHHIAHRDIKPENILLDANLCVKLSDFGFATFVKHDTELTDLCGTPGYLSPEVLRVSMYDNAIGYGRPVDMWACGVIMYTLLTGCPPFWARKQMLMLRAIMEGNYNMSGPVWEDISEQAKDMVRRLLVVDASIRMNADELLTHNYLVGLEEVGLHAAAEIKNEASDYETLRIFNAKTMFKGAAWVVVATVRMRNLHLHPPPLQLNTARVDPYSLRIFRKIIDAGAFRIYGHWVKRGENQNRAALFENVIKKDLKAAQGLIDTR